MNPVHSDMAPDMGSALAPMASICCTTERQRLPVPTIGNIRGSFRSTDQNCMVNAPASSTRTTGGLPDLLQKGHRNSTSDPHARKIVSSWAISASVLLWPLIPVTHSFTEAS